MVTFGAVTEHLLPVIVDEVHLIICQQVGLGSRIYHFQHIIAQQFGIGTGFTPNTNFVYLTIQSILAAEDEIGYFSKSGLEFGRECAFTYTINV